MFGKVLAISSFLNNYAPHRIISVEERANLLEKLDSSSYQVSAGGSLANTLVATSHLSVADHQCRGGGLPRIGMLSVSGNDLQVQCPHTPLP